MSIGFGEGRPNSAPAELDRGEGRRIIPFVELAALELPAGYDPRTQRVVGEYAAALDLQYAQLRREVGGKGRRELEWQPRPGVNTTGMLLAHLAVAECWWFCVIAADRAGQTDNDEQILNVLGIRPDDDGLPIAADGVHPPSLSGWTWPDYDALLTRSRNATHHVLRSWTDVDLNRTHATSRREVQRNWILYHVLEHCSAHIGQILLLRHLMQLEGMWSTKA